MKVTERRAAPPLPVSREELHACLPYFICMLSRYQYMVRKKTNLQLKQSSEQGARSYEQNTYLRHHILYVYAAVDEECLPIEDEPKICTCDLTEAECDVNCCCDQSCSKDDRRAFSMCNDQRV